MTTRYLGFATLVLTACMLGISVEFECGGDIVAIKTQCERFVQKGGPKIPPSKSCCEALKDADITCYCKYLTPDIEKMLSIEKVLFVAKTCRCKNIPTDKCGSYIIPPPPPLSKV
ncbi:unnamed protein product [Lathyrus sativus]|nr:unnamed protein product [Lathyrus sativus]